MDWLAQNNWYFDEGVVLAGKLHREDPATAYYLLSEALQVNGNSIRILKAYIPVAHAQGLDQYAMGALDTLKTLTDPAAFRKYVDQYQLSSLLPQ